MTIGLLRQTNASGTNVTASGKPPQPARAAPPDVCHGSPNDALRALRSGSDGLSAAEAARRLAEFGLFIPLAAAMLVFEEARKLVARRFRGTHP
jgi:hypothetical protein